jgi:hypothetical protein
LSITGILFDKDGTLLVFPRVMSTSFSAGPWSDKFDAASGKGRQ